MGLDMMLRKVPFGGSPWGKESEEVGYWRKANQIHKWFVDNIQNGIDDCGSYKVTKDDLIKLKDLCKYVISKSEMIPGQVHCGDRFEGDKRVPMFVDGKIIKDPSVAQELLPTQLGFFFGKDDYDEHYIYDLENTIKIIAAILETVDFEKFDVYYDSSW